MTEYVFITVMLACVIFVIVCAFCLMKWQDRKDRERDKQYQDIIKSLHKK